MIEIRTAEEQIIAAQAKMSTMTNEQVTTAISAFKTFQKSQLLAKANALTTQANALGV